MFHSSPPVVRGDASSSRHRKLPKSEKLEKFEPESPMSRTKLTCSGKGFLAFECGMCDEAALALLPFTLVPTLSNPCILKLCISVFLYFSMYNFECGICDGAALYLQLCLLFLLPCQILYFVFCNSLFLYFCIFRSSVVPTFPATLSNHNES